MSSRFAVPMLRPEDVIPHLAKGIEHWRDGRSAKELARRWWDAGGFPPSVRQILLGAPEWKGAEFVEAKFEHQTDLGTLGRASQSDLLVVARTSDGMGIVAVEGKADETFGKIVDEWLGTDVDKSNAPEIKGSSATISSGKWARLKSLCETLGLDTKDVMSMRYQLLHRTVAALLEAKAVQLPPSSCPRPSFFRRTR